MKVCSFPRVWGGRRCKVEFSTASSDVVSPSLALLMISMMGARGFSGGSSTAGAIAISFLGFVFFDFFFFDFFFFASLSSSFEFCS